MVTSDALKRGLAFWRTFPNPTRMRLALREISKLRQYTMGRNIMYSYATRDDRDRIEAESEWRARDLPVTTWQMLSRTASLHASRPAVTFQMFSDPGAPSSTLSWAELHEQTAQTANLFRSLGIGEKDVVAYLLPNSMETVLTYLGGQIAGIVNPVNPLLSAEHIGGILKETGAKVVVTLRPFPKTDIAQKLAAALAFAPQVETVLEVDLLGYLTGLKKMIVPFLRPKVALPAGVRQLDFNAERAKQSTQLQFDDGSHDRIATLFHTGGTTGIPKVAQHRYSGIIYNAWLGANLLFTEEDVQMVPLPLFHVFASIVALGASLGSGAHIVFPTPQGYRGEGVFDNFWKLCARYGATFMITVPTAMSALMQRPIDADISKLGLAFCGSSPLPVELYKRFEEAAGVTIVEGYGLTEATCLVSINPPSGEKKVGSIGLPFPYCDVRILSLADQKELGVDETGEICVFNPGVSQDATYTEAAKNADIYTQLEPGGKNYLRTGDLGRLDADGYLWITGRAKDLIIRGGHNIDPAEIEEVLAGHPAVAMVGAIGQPDAYAGEVPCAFVELVEGAETSGDELMNFARNHVQEHAAQPKHIEILDELPKTAVGKIFKPDLRRRAIKRVFDHDLSKGGLDVHVSEVIEVKGRGLVALLHKGDATIDDDAITAILGAHTYPWQWAYEQ